MKPTSEISRPFGNLTGDRRSLSRCCTHPITDYSFRDGSAGAASTSMRNPMILRRPALSRGFRELSEQFFRIETKRDYVLEAVFFGIIVALSTWPIISMVQAMAQLVK